MSLRPRLDINLKHKPLEQISVLAPFSALMISVILVVFFFIRFYLLEGFLLRRLYGRIYADMNESARRGFVNHHIAGVIKMTILAIAIHPFINVAFLQSTFHSPYIPGSIVTMGDILVVTAQMLIAMYIFELLYRATLSPVAVLHHVGTILIGQAAIAISLNLASEPNADMEFVLCTAWGAFDIISELLPHVAIILYRIAPANHGLLRAVCLLACITTAVGTLCETILTMFLFGCLWDRWQLAFKVTTPILHVAFSAAQIHGSCVFWRMYQRQCRLIDEERLQQDLEMVVDEPKPSTPVTGDVSQSETLG